MIGDIILQKRSGWVGWFVSLFTRSDYVHCGIDVGFVATDCYIAHVDWAGKHYTSLAEWGKEIIVLTPVMPLDAKQMENLCQAIMTTEVCGYDFYSAVKSWFWKSRDDGKATGKRYHCSEFVSAMYRKGLGIDLVAGRSDDATQPQDFLGSPHLRRVG
jgi:hypothetical protein